MLSELFKKHAPLVERSLIIRPDTQWITDELIDAKRKRRRLERLWRRTKLTVHQEMFRAQCRLVNRMTRTCRQEYYQAKISENKHNSKELYKVVNGLLHRAKESVIPPKDNPSELASDFNTFFTDKITSIRRNLETMYEPPEEKHPDVSVPSMAQFDPTDATELRKIIMNAPKKSCSLDPMPTWLLNSCLDEVIPILVNIINMSLKSGVVPNSLKHALVTPLLKKSSLDASVLKNYRPVANLTFLSKTLERVVASRLLSHLTANNLHGPFQSAYRPCHSTETALIRVQNDILTSLDKGNMVILVLLDLSAAFDTIDHNILLTRMEHDAAISGTCLQWFASYLANRQQSVLVKGCESSKIEVTYGVPQGSVLGPVSFNLYTTPIANIMIDHSMPYHVYADDTQLYMSFRIGSHSTAAAKIEKCVSEIKSWMNNNWLQLNDSKSEVLLFCSKSNLKHVPNNFNICVGNDEIPVCASARNIGVMFDQHMAMDTHISKICQSTYFQLRSIGKIRRYLSTDAAKLIIHSLVMSRLDYGNSLLFGLPNIQLGRLQRIQNCAARIITRSKRHEHITPVLEKLHWLPVHQRIKYKVLLLTYKALNNLAPPYLMELLEEYHPPRTLRSSGQKLLKVPKFRTLTFGARAFSCAAPTLWNALPQSLRNITTLSTYISALKTHLFRETYK